MTNETTASQPKSIGDDAQFQELLVEYWATTGSDCKINLITYIDNFRAPAAQASATIQAAPRPTDDDLWDATLRDRDAYHEWADKLADAIATHFGVDIGEHSNQNLPWAEALEVIESSATIQEPVMVPEPVAEVVEGATVGMGIPTRDIKFIGASAKVGDKLYLAAPMVADPAGVAVMAKCEECDGKGGTITAEWVDPVSGPEFEGERCEVCGGAGVTDALPLAATVKAVPSEALETVSMPKKPGDEILAMLKECAPKWNSQSIYSGLLEAGSDQIAAPLADKTGGGE